MDTLKLYLDPVLFSIVQLKVEIEVEKMISKYLKETDELYADAFIDINDCDNGDDWNEALWIAEEYVILEKLCKYTKYFKKDDYKKAKEAIKNCNNWNDIRWICKAFMDKYNMLYNSRVIH
jgi:hypothetical protein